MRYATKNGVSNIKYTFWSHGIVYIICILTLIIVLLKYPFTNIVGNSTTLSEFISFPKNKYAGILSLLAGLFAFVALLVITHSFQISKNVGYTVAIISSTCIFTLLLSKLFFNDPINLIGCLGIFCIIVGVYFISRSKNEI